MEDALRNQLLALAAIYAEATGTTLPSIGKLALHDNTFFGRLSAGQGFTIRTYDRLIRWFWENWPKDRPWPPGVPRPHQD